MGRKKKKWMILFCALTLLSLGSMGMLANADPDIDVGGVLDTEKDWAMIETATPPGPPVEPDAVEGVIYLDAWEGSLNSASSTVKLNADGTYPELPDAALKGWTFIGWVDQEVTYEYYGAEDIGNIYEMEGKYPEGVRAWQNGRFVSYTWEDGAEKYVDDLLHKWLIQSEGERVKEGDKADKDVTTLYALYEPKAIDIYYYYNGWTYRQGLWLSSGGQYGSTVFSPDITKYSNQEWEGHVFDGWYDSPKNGEGNRLGETGIIGEGALVPNEDGVINLYIHSYRTDGKGEASALKFVTDGVMAHPGDLVPLTILTEEGDVPELEWSSDYPDLFIHELKNTEVNVRVPYLDPRSERNEVYTITVFAAAKQNPELKASVEILVDHEWDYQNAVVTRAPGCTWEGKATVYCSHKKPSCAAKLTVTIPATGHQYIRKYEAPTCTVPGYDGMVCVNCGIWLSKTELPALGHKMVEETIHGCGGDVTTSTCSVCGYTETEGEVDLSVHQWESTPRIDKPADCHTNGSRSIHCSRCGLTRDSEEIPADPSLHQWKWETILEPTETENGERMATCEVCGAVKGETIPATGPLVKDPNAPAPSDPSENRPSSDSGGSDSDSDEGGSSYPVSSGASSPAPAAKTPLPAVPSAEVRASMPTYVEVGRWDQEADGSWTFKDEKGETCRNRWAALYNPYANVAAGAEVYDWFRFDETGNMITGWYVDPADGNTYYMNPASDGSKGRMVTGWCVIDGKEYYFNTNSDGTKGRMYRNEMTPDGHYVGADGVKIR